VKPKTKYGCSIVAMLLLTMHRNYHNDIFISQKVQDLI